MADLTPEQQATLDSWRATLEGKNGSMADGACVGNPEDAYSFYQYRQGVPYKHQCPLLDNQGDRQVFNPEINACDWPNNVPDDVNPAPR
jgi:hypothetical protein